MKCVENKAYERYQLWKCNVPLLYDAMTSHILPYMSPTVSWLDTEPNACTHRVLYGTNAPTDHNAVHVGEVTLLQDSSSMVGGGPSMTETQDTRLRVMEAYRHEGVVYRARAMPQNNDVFATQSSIGKQFVFKRERDASPERTSAAVRLEGGHTKEGAALSWSPKEEGVLATGGFDGIICVWDIDTGLPSYRLRRSRETCRAPEGVEDVAFHPRHPSMLAAATSGNGVVVVLDLRSQDTPQTFKAHTGSCRGVEVSPHNEILLATCGDQSVKLWDIRHTAQEVFVLRGQSAEVTRVNWATFNEGVLLSASTDHTVCVWDMSRTSLEGDGVGQQGLLFMHQGHVGRVLDVDFCRNYGVEWYVASVAEDWTLHIWQMAEYLYMAHQDEEQTNER